VKVSLKKLSSAHKNLRTDVVVGETSLLPRLGQPFQMFSEPLSKKADIRIISTSPVRFLHEDLAGYICFETDNSVYSLTLLEGEDE